MSKMYFQSATPFLYLHCEHLGPNITITYKKLLSILPTSTLASLQSTKRQVIILKCKLDRSISPHCLKSFNDFLWNFKRHSNNIGLSWPIKPWIICHCLFLQHHLVLPFPSLSSSKGCLSFSCNCLQIFTYINFLCLKYINPLSLSGYLLCR